MSEYLYSDLYINSGVNETPPMSWLSCLLYVAANVAAMVLWYFYQQAKALKLRQEECGYVEKTGNGSIVMENYNYRYSYRSGYTQKLRSRNQSSLLSILGLTYNGYKTFFAFEDRFYTFDEVSRACRKAGLESCGLIVGVDFSASNEWQGRKTFASQNLHKIITGKIYNPYQKVISIMGRTLEDFDEDNLIPAFGFGDSVTTGLSVFPFNNSGESCKGFTQVLERYSEIASRITLGGPTNFAPIIKKAMEIVNSLNKYHILIIIADGQVTEPSSTIEAIVEASLCPLSIVLVGVGDGPWATMEHFDNCLPERKFDNFQFVNFHSVTTKSRKNPETSFALHVMMEIPDQYKTIKTLGYLDTDNENKDNKTDEFTGLHAHSRSLPQSKSSMDISRSSLLSKNVKQLTKSSSNLNLTPPNVPKFLVTTDDTTSHTGSDDLNVSTSLIGRKDIIQEGSGMLLKNSKSYSKKSV